jgi:hypothetical protein
MKRDKSSILAILLIAITTVIIGSMVILVNTESSFFEKVGVLFRYWPMFISCGVMAGSGFWIFLISKSKNIRNTVFPLEGEQSIFFWFLYFLFWGWTYLNILIPYVYLYDISPIGPQEKYHYINSSIPQILETNSSIPVTYALYFLSALPLVLIISFFIDIILKFLNISKKELVKPDIANKKDNNDSMVNLLIEEFYLFLILFQFIYYCANFTYPTIIYLINK